MLVLQFGLRQTQTHSEPCHFGSTWRVLTKVLVELVLCGHIARHLWNPIVVKSIAFAVNLPSIKDLSRLPASRVKPKVLDTWDVLWDRFLSLLDYNLKRVLRMCESVTSVITTTLEISKKGVCGFTEEKIGRLLEGAGGGCLIRSARTHMHCVVQHDAASVMSAIREKAALALKTHSKGRSKLFDYRSVVDVPVVEVMVSDMSKLAFDLETGLVVGIGAEPLANVVRIAWTATGASGSNWDNVKWAWVFQ
ncbi:hypothetical protein MIND_00319600 [Mycena indigotica]|uniref:Uncharacterized protein n=1 Tax=Mycena indigotica TaxID=2126181 RepID=A0A8H6T1W5_9AGAR|nr:uncharacterized protein MIND_00319600 [Mycena indigotica]KAF7309488.1 hypothetical protein MIND_00319600 [Mycena indigotica]